MSNSFETDVLDVVDLAAEKIVYAAAKSNKIGLSKLTSEHALVKNAVVEALDETDLDAPDENINGFKNMAFAALGLARARVARSVTT